ncbi:MULTISPECIES: monofunctional biosynthetic peptidoglycan transglycosylase [unclassified Dysgonomonas]|uniref:monofunctional biosynthetic peptidoglycan transglycosylase n=1 Tax=unclassified Dysgonomonas TaxID=2630389 RepID=UPI0025BBB48A|nr:MULTISPECIES: monofunctional biosynthetic peptidoglycan transglycosylase [unclassified Dysgonomonas]MDR2003337.1 monofunctional biosynthetic peptidoglycan transglycosylase [Prevotella sp.]HMM04550.1 monofunctional biosynthetic peptidoglycan transglycosylase [Dysgonomonas sp.]
MLKKIFKWIKRIVIFLFIFSILQVIVFKFVPVYYTPLMIWNNATQLFSGEEVVCRHTWVPLNEISKYLPLAVVASEDNLFLDHSGFDFDQIEKAMNEAEKGKRQRGASTISQQTAKNVFLWSGRSYVRKGLEVYYTFLIETIWGKERIMEVYLNSIEMGKNIYGAEAVAQAHFKKTAKKLTAGESALIAATLPNPIRFSSAKPSPYIIKRQTKILDLMGKVNPVDFDKEPEPKKDVKKSTKKNSKK